MKILSLFDEISCLKSNDFCNRGERRKENVYKRF